MEKIHFVYLFLLLCVEVDGSSSDLLQRQKRNWIIDSFKIDEGYTGPFPYSLGVIKVEKTLTFFEIHGQGVEEEPKGVLQINNRTGEMTVHRTVDFEAYKEIKLVFVARDHESRLIDTKLGISIAVLDANDHPPVFDNEIYNVSIKESTEQGTSLITVRASDRDTGNNRMFDLRIVSSSSESEDLEFYMTHRAGDLTGTISFRGCLNHEKTDRHVILIEAKDHGEKIQLSSTSTVIVTIQDGNNNIPVMTGRTGPGKVKEGEKDFLVSRLQAKDEDHEGTAAWKIKYQIHGDKKKIYKITTDPVTNEGLLYVTKPLDYEEFTKWNLIITLENEVSYYSCKVESKSSSGLWKVKTMTAESAASAFSGAASGGIAFGGAAAGGGGAAAGGGGAASGDASWSLTAQTMGFSTYSVIVDVEDVNEAPIFDKPYKSVPLFENTAMGQYLVTFSATDPDIFTPTVITYTKGYDPDGWIEVDSETGKVTTTKTVDRESSFVNQSIYTVSIFAADDGTPPMTATASLTIHVKDENDNIPFIDETVFDMCQSDGPSLHKIEPVDPDGEPYSGPFSFKLFGEVDNKWKIDPPQGYSVNLVKENAVLSGHHELLLEASDAQGQAAVYNLSITVCSCLNIEEPDCRARKTIKTTARIEALLIGGLSMVLIAVMLLLTILVTCKRRFKPIPPVEISEQTLKPSNREEPGDDCTVTFNNGYTQVTNGYTQVTDGYTQVNNGYTQVKETIKQVNTAPPIQGLTVTDTAPGYTTIQKTETNKANNWYGLTEESEWKGMFSHHSSMRWSKESVKRKNMEQFKTWGGRGKASTQLEAMVNREILSQILNKRLHSLQTARVELCDYSPRVYTEEGEESRNMELDAISNYDIPFNLDMSFDSKFSTLASICMPSAIASIGTSAKASASNTTSVSQYNASSSVKQHNASSSVNQYNASSSVNQYNASSSVNQYNATSGVNQYSTIQYDANAYSPTTYVMQTLQAVPMIQYEIHETKLDSPTYAICKIIDHPEM